MKILIIEDDELSGLNLSIAMEKCGKVKVCINTDEVISALGSEKFDLAFIDLDLEKDLAGLELVPKIVEQGIYAVVLSGREDEEHIESAYLRGCSDYICKPFSKDILDIIIRKFQFSKESELFKDFFKQKFITQSEKLVSQLEVIKEIVVTKRPVLLLGETGTGKSLFAEALHDILVNDSSKKFVSLNCSAIPENLLESELFGYKKGAFSGADSDKEGLLKTADGGTLFLDEIATMPLDLQKKLLKSIEERSYYPVGSNKLEKSNFNLISATCENLDEMVKEGSFREDFYFRILGYRITLPPLRERKGDIPALTRYFLSQAKRKVVFKEEVKRFLEAYPWPGNIRELKNTIDILIGKQCGIVSLKDIPSELALLKKGPLKSELDFEYASKVGLKIYIEEVEEKLLKHFYDKNDKKVRKTLADLKISNSSFYRVLERIKGDYET